MQLNGDWSTFWNSLGDTNAVRWTTLVAILGIAGAVIAALVRAVVWLIDRMFGKNGSADKDPPSNTNTATATVNVDTAAMAGMLVEQARERGKLEGRQAAADDLAAKDQTIKALSAAIDDLKSREAKNPTPKLEEALSKLRSGDTAAAEAVFKDIAERKTAEGASATREAATAYKHLGAIAFLHDTQKALAAYARAADLDPDDADAWNRLAALQLRVGEIDAAENSLRRVLALGNRVSDPAIIAMATGNLGLIYQTRGDLVRAEEMHLKSLAIHEQLGHREGKANAHGNLGMIYLSRGDLDRAEEMLGKTLAIAEQLGLKDVMAATHSNLGLIFRERGDLDRAEEMHGRSLAICEQLGRNEEIASNYGNLGLLYQQRGDLDRAEEMHRKSLAIEEQLGRKEGMASAYGNLGIIYKLRGSFDQAEEMHRKSFAISELLGFKEGMASQYGNLGAICLQGGDRDGACANFSHALALFTEIGMKPEIEQTRNLMRSAGCSDA